MKLGDLFRRKSPSVSVPDPTPGEMDAAQALLNSGRLDEAVQAYNRIIERQPNFAEPYYKRGNAHNRAGRPMEALADYDRAVALNPEHAYAFCNRGTVLERLKKWEEALASYDRALALNPQDVLACFNRASVLRELGRSEEALASYDRAIELQPGYAEAYVNRGHLLQKLARNEEAAASYGRAIELSPVGTGALRPEQKYLLGARRHLLSQLCDWQGLEGQVQQIAAGLRLRQPVTLPMPALAMFDDPGLQRVAAELWAMDEAPPDSTLGAIARRPRSSDKIRVGYFSADFRTHPVAYLTAGLFEQHDRSKFEVIAFAFGPRTDDVMQQRLAKAFDRFIDVRQQSDIEVAAMAREMGVDIAVNMNGITEHCRSRIFAARAAPIQMSYLGYAGTYGAPYMDYLIADATVVPPDVQADYVEKIVYLPGSFMPFDSQYAIAPRTFTREEVGLPADAVVFCCFNNSFKLTPEVFATWMRILCRCENSVLWLAQANTTAVANLRKAAAGHGVDEKRLVFAQRLDSLPEHLARLRVADLFLDSFPYNAHATSVDSLWAGVPVLTYAGRSFPSRVAASLLTAVGLPELITDSLSQYEELAVKLAADRTQLIRLRDTLTRNRSLFDTVQYARKLEAAYEKAYELYASGRAPDHIQGGRAA